MTLPGTPNCTQVMQDSGNKLPILLFAGTTEGRLLAEFLGGTTVGAYVSTATKYGLECVKDIPNIWPIAGRMDGEEICSFIVSRHIQLVIDATHPFAEIATSNIKEACSLSKVPYLRCLRDMRLQVSENPFTKEVLVASVAEAAEYLNGTAGNILITTGSKELKQYTQIKQYKERCFARVLSTVEAVTESARLGFQGSHLIAMQGPFTKELNTAMLRHTRAEYFVTKESGGPGGFEEKREAASETGATLVVIGRPPETGESIEEVKACIKNLILKKQL